LIIYTVIHLRDLVMAIEEFKQWKLAMDAKKRKNREDG
jgi:hypothetical protein